MRSLRPSTALMVYSSAEYRIDMLRVDDNVIFIEMECFVSNNAIACQLTSSISSV